MGKFYVFAIYKHACTLRAWACTMFEITSYYFYMIVCCTAEQKDDSEILPPIVIKHPKDLSKTYGEEVTLSVAIINSGTLSYQWVKDEKNIESDKFDGNLTSTLKIKSFTPEHVGSYKCRVSNEAGSVDSKCGHIRGK